MQRLELDVLVDVGGKRCAWFYLYVLPMLDQANRPEQHSESDGGADFTFALLALASSQPDALITDCQVLQPHIQLSGFSHHSGFLCIRNGSCRFAPGSSNQ